MITLSFVIPTRNREEQVQLLLQDFSQVQSNDIEVVIADNSDHPISIELSDSRIRVVRPNQMLGMLDNWMFGLSHAQGNFVTFVGSDEVIVPSEVDGFLQEIRSSPAHFVAFLPGYIEWSEVRLPRHSLLLGKVPLGLKVLTTRPSLEGFLQSFKSGMSLNPYNKGAVSREHLLRALSGVGSAKTKAPDYLLSALVYLSTEAQRIQISSHVPVIIGTSMKSTGLAWDTSVHQASPSSSSERAGPGYDIKGSQGKGHHLTLSEEMELAYRDAEVALTTRNLDSVTSLQVTVGNAGLPVIWIWPFLDRPSGSSVVLKVYCRIVGLRVRALLCFQGRGPAAMKTAIPMEP